MCDFQFGMYECRGDGHLWDADSDGYDPSDFSDPCPKCNTDDFLAAAKDDAESTSFYSSMSSSGSGVDIWENAVAAARKWNPEGLPEVLRKIGRVEALKEDQKNDEGYSVEVFDYTGS